MLLSDGLQANTEKQTKTQGTIGNPSDSGVLKPCTIHRYLCKSFLHTIIGNHIYFLQIFLNSPHLHFSCTHQQIGAGKNLIQFLIIKHV